MAIEDLKSKQDLARFIEETLGDLPMNAIKGLPNELALTLRADVDRLRVIIPEGAKATGPIVVPHGLGAVPRAITLLIVEDASGENTYGFRELGRNGENFTFEMNSAIAAGVGGIEKEVEWMVLRGGEILG